MRDYGDTDDDDMAHGIITTNCTTLTTGAEDCDMTIQVTEAGTNETRITIDGDGDVTFPQNSTTTNSIPSTAGASPSVLKQIVGLPKLNVTQSGAALPNGSTTSTDVITPLSASCAPIAAGTEADDATDYVTGSASYEYTAQATAAENDGFDCDVTGWDPGANDLDTAGFWIKSVGALTAGTLDMSLDDGGVVEANADLPAIPAGEWVWIEVDFGADCAATCAGVDGLFIQVTNTGAGTSEMDANVINIDTGLVWRDEAELAIGDVLVGGVISVSAAPTAAGSDNTPSELVEYTDYLVTYQSGADALVFITNQVANYGTTLEALQ
jgi:hypothetical protein